MKQTAIIVSGGGAAPTAHLPEADLVIAADSGIHLADELGLDVDLLVGDLDSTEPDRVAAASRSGVEVEAHSADKDATDLELAMAAALERGASRIVVAGGGAGRLDHLLAVALLLTAERWADTTVEWHAGPSIARIVRDRQTIATDPGQLVSLVPVTDSVVSIRGTRWALDHEDLPRGTSHGVSNEAIGDKVTVVAHRGVVMAITTRSDHE